MKLLVLETIAMSRADNVAQAKSPPYVVHLPTRRAARLRAELDYLGVSFGLPLGRDVPDHREDDEAWTYFGLVLDDVHVWGRVA